MVWITRIGVLLIAILLMAGVTSADDDLQFEWSGTLEMRLKDFQSPVDDDDKTGFFDQYEFTRNKDKEPTIELGLRELDLDVLGAQDTPRLQFRLRSPTSNLSVSGGGLTIAESFLNQRGELYVRGPGLALDLDYRRLRTEELRLFNNEGWITDDTAPDDRFYMRRGRLGGELRIRPQELLTGERAALAGFISEVALRAGYEGRKGRRQSRISFLDQLTTEQDQEVTEGGVGLVFNPGSLFTLAVDFDHQRFVEDAPPDQGTGTTTNFIPDTDRTTGTLRLNSRVGDRAVVRGGLQVSSLRQAGTRTQGESQAGLHRNKLLFYSGNLAADLELSATVSLNGFFKFDHRRNGIEREPEFFDPSIGGQDYPLLESVRKIATGTEFVYRLPRMNRISLGIQGEWIDRNLGFTSPGLTPENTIVDEDTRMFTAYAKTMLRPASGLRLSGEVGYRNAPDTGYIRELEDVGYGRILVSYTLPVARPVTVSVFGRGELGENDDFTQLGGTPGNAADRDFERDVFSYGATVTGSPCDGVTLFGSFHEQGDDQDFDLWTNPDRFAGLDFSLLDPLDYRARVSTAVLGGMIRISEKTDVSLSYSFTRSNWRFDSDNATTDIIDGLSRVRSDLQRAQLEVGHWLREGLRVSGGYRFDKYSDRTDVSTGTGSVGPLSLSTEQHTVIFGLTLNSDLLGKP
jgi:hypothetical protein